MLSRLTKHALQGVWGSFRFLSTSGSLQTGVRFPAKPDGLGFLAACLYAAYTKAGSIKTEPDNFSPTPHARQPPPWLRLFLALRRAKLHRPLPSRISDFLTPKLMTFSKVFQSRMLLRTWHCRCGSSCLRASNPTSRAHNTPSRHFLADGVRTFQTAV